MKRPRLKVDHERYLQDYDDVPRFISYFYQINWVKKLGGKNVLEVGTGNKRVSNYLRRFCKVTTCDFDKRLGADVIADIRKLPFKDNSFDVVICCKVLEHLPFDDFERSLKELRRVTSKYIIISLPYSCLRFDFAFRIQNEITHLPIRLPLTFLMMPNKGEHYWEIGRKGYSINKIREIIIRNRVRIIQEDIPILNPYHQFLILKKQLS